MAHVIHYINITVSGLCHQLNNPGRPEQNLHHVRYYPKNSFSGGQLFETDIIDQLRKVDQYKTVIKHKQGTGRGYE